jgi:hypothetical protein
VRKVIAGLAALGVVLAGSAGAAPAAAARHLIYLHGRILQEEQSRRPRSPQFGYYELDQILEAFRKEGFVVTGEVRPKSATVSDSANRVVEEVRKLIASGVPSDHITVVGASMGAGIALLASARLRNPELRFCILGDCLSENARRIFSEEGKTPAGRLLSIREASDEITEPCVPWKKDGQPGLVVREIVLHTGLRHGFLYRPLPGWVNPAVEWARAR